MKIANRYRRLDFSKINSIIHNNQHLDTEAAEVVANGVLGEVSCFDLGLLVEESVESLVAGHQHSSRAPSAYSRRKSIFDSEEMSSTSQSPTVILNIEHRASWQVESESTSWRRCILNILGNAQKYTDTGTIEVSLFATAKSKHTPSAAVLTIRDTGRGIGKAYLENHLFRPFVQENALSSGTGLGLSIIKSLVDGLHGWVDVQSEVDIGTQVRISVPINFATPLEAGQDLGSRYRDLNIFLVGFEGAEEAGHEPTANPRAVALKSALSVHLGDWLNLNIRSARSSDDISGGIIMIEEDNLGRVFANNNGYEQSVHAPPGSFLVVICTQHSMQHHSVESKFDRLYYLPQPFGPHRLTALISNILRLRDKEKGSVSAPLKDHSSPSQTTATPLVIPVPREGSKHSSTEPSAGPSPKMTPPTRYSPDAEKPFSPNVLLVDDNYVNLTLLERCMKKLKVSYSTASNGAEAVEAYKTTDEPFDYVFMDISMPVMDGFTATRAIRDFEQTSGRPRARIVAMTGLGTSIAQSEGKSSGMDLFLVKPVQMRKVQSLIEGQGEDLASRQQGPFGR